MVAKHGSITRASAELRLAHPTISGQIHRLEEALGEKLFARSSRNLVLTDSGRVAFRYADQIFALPAVQLTTPIAWLGLICYTLQIYFDFSGYSDMAIGLMRMFGFCILENFNYPYISRSVREFWRRFVRLRGHRDGLLGLTLSLLLAFYSSKAVWLARRA